MEKAPVKTEKPHGRKREALRSVILSVATVLSSVALISAIVVYQIHFAKRNYEPGLLVIPSDPERSSTASPVEVGLSISNFSSMELHKGHYVIDGTVWFRYPQGTQSLDTISRFSIRNAIPSSVEISKPMIRLEPRHVVVAYAIRARIIDEFVYKDFPVDAHRISVVIENKSVSDGVVRFETKDSNFAVRDDVASPKWKLKGKFTDAGIGSEKVGSPLEEGDEQEGVRYFPRAAFYVDFENSDTSMSIILYLMLFVLMFLTLTSFLRWNIAGGERMLAVSSGVSGLILFKFVLRSVGPESSTFTRVDILHALFLAISFLVLLYQTAILAAVRVYHTKAEYKSSFDDLMLVVAQIDRPAFIFSWILVILSFVVASLPR